MGTMLFEAGLQFGDPPEVWNLTQPDLVRRIHRGYLDAGSRILLTNTFGGNRLRLCCTAMRAGSTEFNRTAAILLRAEVDAAGGRALVAGDIGPSGQIMAPLGTLELDEAVDTFAEQAAALVAGGVDVIWIETMSDLAEIHAAIEGVRRASPDIPIIATMTFDTRGHTMMGVSPEAGRRGPDRFGVRRDRRQLRQRPGGDGARAREDARGRAGRRPLWPSPTSACRSWSTGAPSTSPTPRRWPSAAWRCARPAPASSVAAAAARPSTSRRCRWPWRARVRVGVGERPSRPRRAGTAGAAYQLVNDSRKIAPRSSSVTGRGLIARIRVCRAAPATRPGTSSAP